MTELSRLGSYRLLAELGHGGMADVFLAAVEGPAGFGFTKLAVVKKVRSHLAEDEELVSMLKDEARLTARLSHPNVVQLFEVGQEGDEFFIAMEYLEGQPLQRIMRRGAQAERPVPNYLYYAVVSQVLAGLHHAHELADYDDTPLQVVHRDVTPHNVFVTYDGAVKVVDFGIAKAKGRSTETRQGVVKGKYRYMSPEQASGKELDRRTDIFAVGVILWGAATGRKRWVDDDDLVVMHKLCQGDYDPSPRSVAPDVPREIDAICQRALAFDREDRYATAEEMRADLDKFLRGASAEQCRELGSMMKELFEEERAKVRAVIEASGLAGGASMTAFKAAVAARSANANANANATETPPVVLHSDSDSDVAAAHTEILGAPGGSTELMPGAPPRPLPAPAAAPSSAIAPVPASAPAAASAKPKRSRIGPVLGLLAAAAMIAFAVRATYARRSSAVASAAARTAEVASEMTPRVGDVASKDDPQQRLAGNSKTPAPRGKATAASAVSPGRTPPPERVDRPAPAASAPKPSLDKSDPWTAH